MKIGKLRKGNNSNAKGVITKIGYLFNQNKLQIVFGNCIVHVFLAKFTLLQFFLTFGSLSEVLCGL